MLEINHVSVVKLTEQLVIGDLMLVGGVFAEIKQINVDPQGATRTFQLIVIGASSNKKLSKMTLILSTKLPVTVVNTI